MLDKVASLAASEPWPGYDELTVEEVQTALSPADEERVAPDPRLRAPAQGPPGRARGDRADRGAELTVPAEPARAGLAGIAFDAFGTLFDLQGLRPRLEAALDDRGGAVLDGLLARLVPWTWHATAAGRYRPFPEVATLALAAAAAQEGVPLAHEDAAALARGLTELPPHPDVAAGLESLAADGHRLAVLSNGTADAVHALVESAGLAERFDHLLAADQVGRFKPAPEVYAMAPRAFAGASGEVMLVSAHPWDVAGAGQSGMLTALLHRGEPAVPVLGVEPTVVVRDVEELAGALRGMR